MYLCGPMPCSSERTWRQSRSGVCRKHATAPGICANHTQQITRIDLKNHQEAQRERKIDAAPAPTPTPTPITPHTLCVCNGCEHSQLLMPRVGRDEVDRMHTAGGGLMRSSNVCVIKCSGACSGRARVLTSFRYTEGHSAGHPNCRLLIGNYPPSSPPCGGHGHRDWQSTESPRHSHCRVKDAVWCESLSQPRKACH